MTTSIIKTDILCYGQNTGNINLTVTGGVQPYSYHWNNGATVEDLINVTSGIYSVTVTDVNGCTRVDGATISAPNELTIAITPPSQSICLGQNVNLSITATGGTPPYIYYWNNQTSNPTLSVTPQTTTTYSAYVTDANGCTSNVLNSTITVSAPIHVELTQNTDYICPGEVVELFPIVSGGVQPYTIYDQLGNIVSPPTYVYPNHTGYYWIMAKDACNSTDSAGVTIHVYPLPPADALADTVQGCVPLTVHFIEVNPDSGQTYVWNFGDQSNLSLAKNPVHTYTSPGTFSITLTVTSINNCKTTVTYSHMITVWPKPNAQFVWNPEIVTEIEPTVLFTNYSTLANSYIWTFGDGDSTNTINPVHHFPAVGTYNVMLIAISDKGCKDTANAVIKVLEQYTFYAPTAFSPNNDGYNDFFYVMAHAISDKDFKLEVYDRWGEVIWSTDKFYKDLERSEQWDGKVKGGKTAPIGTYTWQAFFRDWHNRLHEEVGAVNVIR
jgi:gliding motility-associated-like protein